MEKTENKPILVGVASIPFKFELSQLVEPEPDLSEHLVSVGIRSL